MYRAYNVITPNQDLPVSLESVKQHLNMDDLSHADATIIAHAKAACSHIEKQYGMALLTQTIKEYWSEFPCSAADPMLLRIQPIQSITSVEYVDSNGDSQTWDPDEWNYGGYNGTTFIIPNPNASYPSTWATPNAICITYQAGYGAAPENVPAEIGQAINLMVADSFQRREDSPQTFTRASENLLRPYFRFAI